MYLNTYFKKFSIKDLQEMRHSFENLESLTCMPIHLAYICKHPYTHVRIHMYIYLYMITLM